MCIDLLHNLHNLDAEILIKQIKPQDAALIDWFFNVDGVCLLCGRRLHNEELCDSYSPPNIIRVMK
jgi:hypothetical protein